MPWALVLALASAGRSMPARIAIIAITTSSSMRVKPRFGRRSDTKQLEVFILIYRTGDSRSGTVSCAELIQAQPSRGSPKRNCASQSTANCGAEHLRLCREVFAGFGQQNTRVPFDAEPDGCKGLQVS